MAHVVVVGGGGDAIESLLTVLVSMPLIADGGGVAMMTMALCCSATDIHSVRDPRHPRR